MERKVAARKRLLSEILASGELEALKDKVREAEQARATRIEQLMAREPQAVEQFFGEGKLYPAANPNPSDEDMDARINDYLLTNRDPAEDEILRDMNTTREVTPLSKAIRAGQTEFTEPENQEAYTRLQKMRTPVGGRS